MTLAANVLKNPYERREYITFIICYIFPNGEGEMFYNLPRLKKTSSSLY